MSRKRKLVETVGYVRATSATNVGPDKDSERRQRLAIERYAKAAGYDIVEWFADPAVSGADAIETRPGFAALLDRTEANGVKTVIVEDASRFARDLVAQELGVLMLIKRGVDVLTANGDSLTDTSEPSRIMMQADRRQLQSVRESTFSRQAACRPRAQEGRNRQVWWSQEAVVVAGAPWIPLLSGQDPLNPPPLLVRQLISLDHLPRSESFDPERNESVRSPAENPECRLDLVPPRCVTSPGLADTTTMHRGGARQMSQPVAAPTSRATPSRAR
jgi:hypothetical protein